jgi:hypothetical protein
MFNLMGNNDDAVDERKLILCCALCCANVSFYPSCDAIGCSGKVRTFRVASVGMWQLFVPDCCPLAHCALLSHDLLKRFVHL